MKIIGITGGVGSGKSEILKILKEDYGAQILIADQIAHELMKPGAISYDEIVDFFGRDILKEDQTIDRERLGEIVFHDKDKLLKLNKMTHHNVDQELIRRIHKAKQENKAMVVCEAALLVGAEYEKLFDQLWYIYTKEEVRRERLKASRGYSDEKISQMIKNQKSENEFRRLADHMIDNSGDIEETKCQIKSILK